MGPNSPTDPEELKAQLSQIKKQGYSICIDEMHENVVSIAAPVQRLYRMMWLPQSALLGQGSELMILKSIDLSKPLLRQQMKYQLD